MHSSTGVGLQHPDKVPGLLHGVTALEKDMLLMLMVVYDYRSLATTGNTGPLSAGAA